MSSTDHFQFSRDPSAEDVTPVACARRHCLVTQRGMGLPLTTGNAEAGWLPSAVDGVYVGDANGAWTRDAYTLVAPRDSEENV